MDTTSKLTDAAERLFDRLTKAARMSSRTLYKHVGSKTGLMARVLTECDRRFMARPDSG